MNDEIDMKLAVSIVEQFLRTVRFKIKQSQLVRHLDGLKKTWKGQNTWHTHEKNGIFYTAEKEAFTLGDNWTSKLDNLIRTIKQWENRNPNLYRKVTVAKTLLLSQFSHDLHVLALPQSVLTRTNTIIYRFLWKRKYNNKRVFEKIKRNMLNLDVEEGGMKTMNSENQQKHSWQNGQR